MESPKRPVSAYMHFCCEKKPDIIREHPEFTFAEIIKTLGTIWRNMSDDEKNVYIKLQEEGKQAYEQVIREYNQSKINGIITRNNQIRNEDDLDNYDAC